MAAPHPAPTMEGVTSVVVQMGHVPRKTGATGTYREQELTTALGARLAALLRGAGHDVHLIGADDKVPASDVFVALHGDGSLDPKRRGASVGYPDDNGGRLAAAWKRAHDRAGYPGGWHPDNYTKALRGYYGFARSKAPYRFLAEHGTLTNAADCAWLFDHLDGCARAHVEAIDELLGSPAPPDQEDDMAVILRVNANTPNPADDLYAVSDFIVKRGVTWPEIEPLQKEAGLKVVDVSKVVFDGIPVAR